MPGRFVEVHQPDARSVGRLTCDWLFKPERYAQYDAAMDLFEESLREHAVVYLGRLLWMAGLYNYSQASLCASR